jgi:hypothetical protein
VLILYCIFLNMGAAEPGGAPVNKTGGFFTIL